MTQFILAAVIFLVGLYLFLKPEIYMVLSRGKRASKTQKPNPVALWGVRIGGLLLCVIAVVGLWADLTS